MGGKGVAAAAIVVCYCCCCWAVLVFFSWQVCRRRRASVKTASSECEDGGSRAFVVRHRHAFKKRRTPLRTVSFTLAATVVTSSCATWWRVCQLPSPVARSWKMATVAFSPSIK
mmetsp:Transcript_12104/g.38418  ORF Transcript_12104/g.38418 Transcript_12104/m.38418 type:complete len:114 (-) Transcript_12104:527-868(-)